MTCKQTLKRVRKATKKTITKLLYMDVNNVVQPKQYIICMYVYIYIYIYISYILCRMFDKIVDDYICTGILDKEM